MRVPPSRSRVRQAGEVGEEPRDLGGTLSTWQSSAASSCISAREGLHIKVSDNNHIRWRGRVMGKALLVKRCIIALD